MTYEVAREGYSTPNIESILDGVKRALEAKIEANKRYLACGREVRKAHLDYLHAKEALFNLEHDTLQEQEMI